ncbi:MAG: hypothetical protein ACI97A_000488 [Planctomycetota bacterium]|jgi:hypothetical protein
MLSLRSILIILFLSSQQALASQPQAQESLNEAPHLFIQNNGSVLAKWIDQGEVQSQAFAKGKPIVLPQFQELLGKKLLLQTHKPSPAIWKMPKKLFAISDVEGEYERVLRFLKTNHIVDKKGRWAYGKGHLVCIGDFVDRGLQVTEVLLFFHRLDREALQAGGRVHFLIGNHEAMVMGGDVRYTAPKYKESAAKFGIEIKDLLGPDTEIGRWLRTRNSLIRIGEFVFVHAGVSPQVASKKVDYQSVNWAIQQVLGQRRKDIQKKYAAELTWGRTGPLWYRGYFDKHAEKYGPTPDSKAVDQILKNLGGKTIVIGHTKVSEIKEIYSDRRVIDIDTTWTKDKKAAGLLIDKDGIKTVDMFGKQTKF